MEIEDFGTDFDINKSKKDLLITVAKEACGYVYYEGEVQYDGYSRPKRIVINEKYRKPNPKFATMLEKKGVEVVMQSHS
jgi:hypothetical protein